MIKETNIPSDEHWTSMTISLEKKEKTSKSEKIQDLANKVVIEQEKLREVQLSKKCCVIS